MALTDLMKKGFLTSATATPATSATNEKESPSTVATVATVAVASSQNLKNRFSYPINKLPFAAVRELFRFDLIQQDIEAGADLAELDRLNNMAWEFMQADGLEFSESIKMAAEIVANCQAAACEAAYTKVRDLIERQGNALH